MPYFVNGIFIHFLNLKKIFNNNNKNSTFLKLYRIFYVSLKSTNTFIIQENNVSYCFKQNFHLITPTLTYHLFC